MYVVVCNVFALFRFRLPYHWIIIKLKVLFSIYLSVGVIVSLSLACILTVDEWLKTIKFSECILFVNFAVRTTIHCIHDTCIIIHLLLLLHIFFCSLKMDGFEWQMCKKHTYHKHEHTHSLSKKEHLSQRWWHAANRKRQEYHCQIFHVIKIIVLSFMHSVASNHSYSVHESKFLTFIYMFLFWLFIWWLHLSISDIALQSVVKCLKLLPSISSYEESLSSQIHVLFAHIKFHL